MPNPKTALEVLEAAKKAYKAKFTPGFYHSSAKPDIEAFDPNAKQNPWIAHSYEKTPRGAVFVGRNPKFTESLIGKGISPENKIQEFQTGATTYPVSVKLGNHFDYDTPEGQALIREFKLSHPEFKYEALEKGSWDAIEKPAFLNFLKNQGYDTFSTQEVGFKNVGVFNPKNIRGKFAEYNPEHAESADFMKAEGGQINPIKTPREMLLDLVQVPHMAVGGKLPPTMQQLVNDAIKKYVQLYKKMPPAKDIKALKAHAQAISQKPTIWHDPVTQARARHQLATDPNLMDPDAARDPFLTQAMTGRTVKGTQLQPKPLDIHDPAAQKEIGEFQLSSGMTNPTEELAGVATALENKAAEPIIEKLRMQFFKKNKRLPTQEELEAEIAAFNPLRHQYGTAGTSIVRSRPPTAKGMQEWKEQARVEGVPESYLEKSPADYRKNLQDELAIGRGEQPTVSPMADDLIANPDRQYASGGRITPDQMLAEMTVHGHTPQKFAKGHSVIQEETVYDPSGMPVYNTYTGEEIKGRSKDIADLLHSIAAVPVTAANQQAQTAAGIAQILGMEKPAKLARELQSGMRKQHPIAAEGGEYLGAFTDPLLLKVGFSPKMQTLGRQAGLGAATGFVSPLEEDEGMEDRLIGAGTGAATNALLMAPFSIGSGAKRLLSALKSPMGPKKQFSYTR